MDKTLPIPAGELEDQFILRLPKEDSKVVHNILKSAKPKKIKKVLKIKVDDNMSDGTVHINKKVLHARLFNLPTIVEASKTVNKVNLYKTADVSQMLLCQANPFPVTAKENSLHKDKSYNYPHGLTPPMKNVRKQRFRKTLRNHEEVKEVEDVQKEVSLLLRMDYEAVSSRYEIINNPTDSVPQNYDITEHMLFGHLSSDSEAESSSTGLNDIIEFNN